MQPAPAPDAARPSAGGEEGADDGDAQEQEEEKEEVRDPFIFRRTFELPSLDLLSEPDRNAVQREDADFYKQGCRNIRTIIRPTPMQMKESATLKLGHLKPPCQ